MCTAISDMLDEWASLHRIECIQCHRSKKQKKKGMSNIYSVRLNGPRPTIPRFASSTKETEKWRRRRKEKKLMNFSSLPSFFYLFWPWLGHLCDFNSIRHVCKALKLFSLLKINDRSPVEGELTRADDARYIQFMCNCTFNDWVSLWLNLFYLSFFYWTSSRVVNWYKLRSIFHCCAFYSINRIADRHTTRYDKKALRRGLPTSFLFNRQKNDFFQCSRHERRNQTAANSWLLKWSRDGAIFFLHISLSVHVIRI